MSASGSADESRTHYAISNLIIDYWNDVDYDDGASAHAFFEEDGVFDAHERVFNGRDAIRRFYEWRKDRGARLARHVISNLRVNLLPEGHAGARWVMLLYAADGIPVQPSNPPIMIADVDDLCVPAAGGGWLFRRRTLRPCFMSGVRPTVPPEHIFERR